MGTAVITWLALLSTAQAPEVYSINQRDPRIPIVLPSDPQRRAEIHQLHLWASRDEGKNWVQQSVASPDQESFPFVAPADGVYWFNVSILDKSGRQDPPDVSAVPPALKMIIDTRKPIVRLTAAERQGDQVSVAWEVQDEYLKLDSFKLEYRTAESPTWYVALVSPPVRSGQKRWGVTTSGPVTVRLRIEDAAGNEEMDQRELAGNNGNVTLTAGPPSPAAPAAPIGSGRTVAGTPASNPFPAHNWDAARGSAPASQRGGAEMTRPALANLSALNRGFENANQQVTPSPQAAPPPAAAYTGPRVLASSDPNATPVAPAGLNVSPTPASSPGFSQVSAATAGGTGQPPRPSGPVQFSNSNQVDLNYEVKVGPAGVEAIELWCTQDDGRTWRKLAEHFEVRPPFSVELGEGMYGFTMTVRAKNGLGRQGPAPGDAPEIRLEVDATAPTALILEPIADPRRKDLLLLQWNAGDRNLASVAWQWAERPGGPWHLVGANVPNTGRFAWQMPPNLPYRIYLRLEARDQAGNATLVETPVPVLVDFVEPEGKLTGITAPGRKN